MDTVTRIRAIDPTITEAQARDLAPFVEPYGNYCARMADEIARDNGWTEDDDDGDPDDAPRVITMAGELAFNRTVDAEVDRRLAAKGLTRADLNEFRLLEMRSGVWTDLRYRQTAA